MNTLSEQRFTPLELETRPTVDTATAAHHLLNAPQTLRIWACKETGPIRPIRLPGSAKLHWSTAELRRLLNVVQRQGGFISFAYIVCLLGAGLLIQAVLVAWPDILNGLDLTGIAMLGVIGHDTASRRYFDLSALAAAAKANDCTVHLHQEADGRNVFSVGNSNIAAREFASYDAAMKFASGGKLAFTESDCAAQAGAAIAENCLDEMNASDDQADHANLLAKALIDLPKLKHHEHAAGGFAGALIDVIERGLRTIGTAAQRDNISMQNEVGRMMADRESESCNGPSNIEYLRRPLGTLGDCLAETASHQPYGYARLTGCTESFWRDIPADNPDKPWFVLEGVTACLDPAPVTIFISNGTTAATAREILKKAAKWLKEHGDELHDHTPRESEPTAGDDDFIPF